MDNKRYTWKTNYKIDNVIETAEVLSVLTNYFSDSHNAADYFAENVICNSTKDVGIRASIMIVIELHDNKSEEKVYQEKLIGTYNSKYSHTFHRVKNSESLGYTKDDPSVITAMLEEIFRLDSEDHQRSVKRKFEESLK